MVNETQDESGTSGTDSVPTPNPKKQLKAILDRPEVMEELCAHVASGGSPITLCKAWGINYGKFMNWLRESPERERRLAKAMTDRTEWIIESVLHEVREIALADIRLCYAPDGSLKSPHEWPDAIAKAVSSVEIDEIFDGYGEDRQLVGHSKKLKLWDKLKAIELVGKNVRIFTERVEHGGVVKLEDLVMASWKPKEPTDAEEK